MFDRLYESAAARSVEQLLTAVVTEGLLSDVRIAELPPVYAATCAGRIGVQWDCVENTPRTLLDAFTKHLPEDVAEEVHLSTRRLAHTLPLRASPLRELATARSSLVFSEQNLTHGHSIHPFPRNRVGFSDRDNYEYAPEHTSEISLRFLALDRGATHGSGVEEVIRREHPAVWSALHTELREGEVILPVHPWQAERASAFIPELQEAGGVRALRTRVLARPLLSLRTLAPTPTDVAHPSHMKTALGVRVTGSVRQVSPELVASAPALSSVLERTLRQDRVCAALSVASEFASIGVHPTYASAGMLGCVLREDPESLLPSSDLAVVAAALRHPQLMQELLAEVDAQTWVREYSYTLLPPLITLLTRYGIAAEAHAQNTVIALSGASPSAVCVRDLGGVLISRERFAVHGAPSSLSVQPKYWRDSVVDGRRLLLYSLLREHCGELLPIIAAVAGVSEHSLWESVAVCVHTILRDVAQCCTACAQNAAEDRTHFFAPTLPMKAHLRNRLTSEAISPRSYVTSPNPLYRFREQVSDAE